MGCRSEMFSDAPWQTLEGFKQGRKMILPFQKDDWMLWGERTEEQKLENCKRPDNKYFRPYAPQTVPMATTQLCHCVGKTALEGTHMNGCGFVPIKLY